MRKLGEQYKSRPWGLVWAAAGAQPELEAALDIGGAGYPAFAAISPKKERAAKAMGTFEAEKLMSFVASMMDGKTSVFTVQLPAVAEVAPWDGKEGQVLEEEVCVSANVTLHVSSIELVGRLERWAHRLTVHGCCTAAACNRSSASRT
jgi:hypothetical protein